MTRNRFIKLLMASGYSRNEAALLAAIAQSNGVPYKEAIGNDAAYQFRKEIEHMQSVIAEALPCVIQGIVNAMSDVAKVILTYLPAAVEAAKKFFEAYQDAKYKKSHRNLVALSSNRKDDFMSKNGLIQRQRATNMAFFNAGLESGRQQVIDMLCLVLHDPDIMGKDTFGRDRLLKVIKGISNKIDEYYLAWQRNDEADYWQAKLDADLESAFGVKLQNSFYQRYEYSPEFNYAKGRWSK